MTKLVSYLMTFSIKQGEEWLVQGPRIERHRESLAGFCSLLIPSDKNKFSVCPKYPVLESCCMFSMVWALCHFLVLQDWTQILTPRNLPDPASYVSPHHQGDGNTSCLHPHWTINLTRLWDSAHLGQGPHCVPSRQSGHYFENWFWLPNNNLWKA